MGNRGDSYFAVVDGIDGAGKEKGVNTVINFFRNVRKPHNHILDLDDYWVRNHRHPQFEHKYSERDGTIRDDYLSLEDFDIVKASEPAYTGIGITIRDELVGQKGRYTAKFTAQQFAADRLVLYTRLLIPALNEGKIWAQSRSFSTSVVYQKLQAADLKESLSLQEILSFDGNQLAMQNPPNLLIIPVAKDVERILERTKKRKKDDKTFFENVAFQQRLEKEYESNELKEFFEKLGTKVVYVDADAKEEETQQQIVKVLEQNYHY